MSRREENVSSLGRRLLSIRNRIRQSSDPREIRELGKREVRTLLDLDRTDLALKAAEELLEDNPDWPAGLALLGDVRMRSGQWEEAESSFARAVSLRKERRQPSEGLALGPLYILSEARGDYSRCLELAAGEQGELALVLQARAERNLGDHSGRGMPDCSEKLAARLALLERAWRGSDPRDMPGIALEWTSEREWRWRFLVEGVMIFAQRGLDRSRWRKALDRTRYPILDPRCSEERSRMLSMLKPR